MSSESKLDLSPDAAKPGTCKTIHHAINEVRKQVSYIQKKKPAGLNYSIAAIDEIIRDIRPLLNYYGVLTYAEAQSPVSDSTYKTSKGSEMREVIVSCTWKLVHADSDTSISSQTIGQAADSGDKAVPKANTAAYKEMLKRTFVVESGDLDPDTYASQQRVVTESGVRSASFVPAKTALLNAKDENDLTRLWGHVTKRFNPGEERDELWKVHEEVKQRFRGSQLSGSAAGAVSNGTQHPAPATNGNGRRQPATR